MNEAYQAGQKGDAAEAARLVAETWDSVLRAGPALDTFPGAVQQITQWYSQNHGLKAEAIFDAALKRALPLGESHPTFQQLLLGQAQFYLGRQQEMRAQRVYERALASLEPNEKAEPWMLQAGRSSLASLYESVGKLQMAEAMLRRLAEKPVKKDPAQWEDPSPQIVPLAQFYARHNREEEAERLLEQALADAEQQPGPNQQWLLNRLNDLHWQYQSQRRYAEAEKVLERIIAINQTLPEGADGVRSNRQQLAQLYQASGKQEEANHIFRSELEELASAKGMDSLDYRQALMNYAVTLRTQKDFTEAEKLMQQYLATAPDEENGYSPVEQGLLQLSQIYQERGDPAKVEETQEQIEALRRKRKNPDDPLGVGFEIQKAQRAANEQRAGDVNAILERGLALAEMTPGAAACVQAAMAANSANLLINVGRAEEADQFVIRAAAICDRVSGGNSYGWPSGRRIKLFYYTTRERWPEAERLLREELVAAEAEDGADGPAAQGFIGQLAHATEVQGKLGETERLRLYHLASQEQTRGDEHPQLTAPLGELAQFYESTRQPDKAEPVWQRAIDLAGKSQQSDISGLLANAAGTLAVMKEHDRAALLLSRALDVARLSRPAPVDYINQLEERLRTERQAQQRVALAGNTEAAR